MTPRNMLQRKLAYMQNAIEAVSLAAQRHLALTGNLPLHYPKAHEELRTAEVLMLRAVETTPKD